MHEPTMWLAVTLAGVALGMIFYGGLWWTVRKGVDSRQPALWFLGSMLLRLALVAAGLALVGGGDWRRVLLCLIGVAIGRIAVTRMTRADTQPDRQRERPHAS
jgi:F1F0 ATPase subunit 2